MLPYIVVSGRHISVYGLAAAVGLLVAVFYLKRMVKRDIYTDLDRDLELAITSCLLGTAIGSRILYLVIEAGNILDAVKEYGFTAAAVAYIKGGFVFYGGLFGCIAALYLYSRRSDIEFPHFLQLMLPAIPLAHAFGRLGCFLTGCCYGVESHAFYSVIYCNSQFAPNGVPLVPVQILEAFLELILFVILFRDSKRGEDGILMLGKYLTLYGTARFVLEFFRGDKLRGYIGALSVSQIISLICLFVGAAVSVRYIRKAEFK